MIQFFQSVMGQKFYQSDVPKIAKNLEKIGNELAEQNRLKRIELGLEELPTNSSEQIKVTKQT